MIKRGHSGGDSAERDLTRWRWVITPKCYVCSCYGISSVESRRFWVYVISRYTREVGSLTSTSLVHGLDSCEQTWEFVVFNMDFRMRGRVLRTLYFHGGSNVFIVTSDARRLAQASNYRWRHIYLMIFLSDNTNCPNCSGSLEDNNHFLLICPKFNNLLYSI